MVIINRGQTASRAITSACDERRENLERPGDSHPWEAVIIRRRHRLYKIKIIRRAHIRSNQQMSDDVYVQPGPTRYAFTPGAARRQAQLIVERRNRRDGVDVPIARTIEVRPRAWS